MAVREGERTCKILLFPRLQAVRVGKAPQMASVQGR